MGLLILLRTYVCVALGATMVSQCSTLLCLWMGFAVQNTQTANGGFM
jgi:hypothetical protein